MGEQRVQVGHQRELGLAAGFPTQFQRRHEVAELLAIEDHALKNAVYEGLQGGDGGEFLGVLLGLEAGVAVTDGLFRKPRAGLERADVFGDVVALVDELGVTADEADELFAGHLGLARFFGREAGHQLHDVVVVDDGGGEEDELEVELFRRAVGAGFVVGLVLLRAQLLGGVQILTLEAAQGFFGQHLLDAGFVFPSEVGVLVELGFEPLHFLETLDEYCLGGIALQVGDGGGGAIEVLRLQEGRQLVHGGFQFLDDDRGFFHQPDFARLLAGLFSGEQRDGGIDGILLLAEIEDVAVGLGAVEHAVGAREGLDQAVVLEVLVHVERVQKLGIEAGEQHVHDDGDVDLLRSRVVGIRPLLVFDALLHILVVEVELAQAVIGAVAGVVVGEDAFKRLLLRFWLDFVVFLLLREVFGELVDVLFAFGIFRELRRRREDAGDVQRLEVGVGGLFLGLHRLEQRVVFDGVVDGRGSEEGVEAASSGGGVVLGEDGFNHCPLGDGFAGFGWILSFRLEVIDVEAQHIAVFDGVGNGVGVELFLEQVLRGAHRRGGVFDLLLRGVGLEDGRAGEAEKLGAGEERLDGLVVLAKLRAVAFVENEDDALVTQRFELLLVGGLAVFAALFVALAVFIQREAELLDGGDDDLVGVVLGQQAAHEGGGVGVFLHAAFLEAVEFPPRLAVEVFAVHDEHAFVDVVVFLEQGGCFERGERFAAAGGVPDVAVAVIFVDALDHVLHGIDLIGSHHHELLLTGKQHHVAADGLAKLALFQEAFGEGVELGDLAVVLVREFIDGQKALVGIESEVAGVVVGKVIRAVAVADDEQLHEAQQRLGVAVAGVVLVFDDLLHGPARMDAQGLQLDLHTGHAVDEEDDVVAVVAVVGIDAQLVDDLEGVFAPVLEVDEAVVQRRAVVAGEGIDAAQGLGGGENIRSDDLIQQAGELGIGEADAVERFKVLAEIGLQRGAVADVIAIVVFEVLQGADEAVFDGVLADGRMRAISGPTVGVWGVDLFPGAVFRFHAFSGGMFLCILRCRT
ncbi:protein of unknown function [Acidithiobacillus ferrivorans]|uniref:NAD-specific glutamate dehydrogenase n=1 Tax=Acidithiobacillus ferrivorans TaxID=160808 RepID=A0ABY1MRL8_9PROT|nr:protein of unknown function [Acidithiobacillus ferrivorans]